MLKIFFQYFLSLTFIFISLINDVQAMEERKPLNHRAIFAQRRAQEQAANDEQDRKALEREIQRKEAVKKVRKENEEKRKHIRDAEELIEAGEDTKIENNIQQLEDAIRNNCTISKNDRNRLMTEVRFLVDEKDNPENNARGVILSQAIAHYFGAGLGDLDSAIEYIKYTNNHDPDANNYHEILCGIKSKREKEIETAAQEKEKEIGAAKKEGEQEATKRGMLIGAGSVVAVVATLYGLSYVFGNQPSATGNL